MKYITLSTSRLQYNTHGGIASEHSKVVLTGEEAYKALYSVFHKARKPIKKQIKELREICENHPGIEPLRAQLSRYRLSQDEEYTVTIITPKNEWTL